MESHRWRDVRLRPERSPEAQATRAELRQLGRSEAEMEALFTGERQHGRLLQAIRAGRDSKMAGVVVLAETQQHLASEISVPPGRARILHQPVNLRDVRREIELAIEARAKSL